MGRFVGLSVNKGKGGGGSVKTESFTRATGITTDSSNHVTDITLGDTKYSKMEYNNVGLVTGFNETISGTKKGWILEYDSEGLVTSINERIPPHPNPSYNLTASTTTITENTTVTFNLSLTDIADGTFYWKADGSSVTTSDFTGGAITGSVTTSGGSAQISLTTVEDTLTEGNEAFAMKIYTDSGYTNLVATSPTVTISDTSVGSVTNVAFYTPGTTSWTCPAGVTRARVIVIGGGGSGGADGGGAGGGAALKLYTNLSPGASYSLTVGAGGARINSGNGQTGGTSEFQGPGQTITGTGGAGWGQGTNIGQYGGGGGVGSGGDINGTGGSGSPYANDPVSQWGYTTNPNGAGTNGSGGGGGGGSDNGNAINGGAGSYFAGGGGGGGADNGQGGDGGDGGTLRLYEFVSSNTRAFGGGGGGTDGTNSGVFGGPGGDDDGQQGQGYGDGSNDLDGGDGGGPAVNRGEKGLGIGQQAGGGGGGAFGGGGGGAGHNNSNQVAGAGGAGLVYITYGTGAPSTYSEEA